MAPPLKRLKPAPYDVHESSLISRPGEAGTPVAMGSTGGGAGVEVDAEESEDATTPITAGLLFAQDAQSDSQTPPASLDEESATFGGVSSTLIIFPFNFTFTR